MKQTLFMNINRPDFESVEWLLLNHGTGEHQSGEDNPDRLPAAENIDRVILLIPTDLVIFARVEIPSRNERQVQLAARSLIEDRLIDSTDSMHIVTRRLDHNQVQVAAINASILQQVMDQFRKHGLLPDVVLPGCLLLPYHDQHWTILEQADSVLVRTGIFGGLQVQRGWLNDIEPSALPENLEPPRHIHVYHNHGDHDPQCVKAVFERLFPDAGTEIYELQPGQHLIDFAMSAGPVDVANNLLTGKFRPRNQNRKAWINWHLPFHATAAGLAVFTLALFLQGMSLENRLHDTRDRIDQLFRKTFPEVRTVVDYRAQFERGLQSRLAGGQAGQNVLALIHNILSRIQNEKGLSLLQLALSRDNVTVDLYTPDIATARRLIISLGESGRYEATLLSSQNTSRGNRIRIRVSQERS